jgi:prevent-host-death family protein
MQIAIAEAKAQFAELIRRAAAGEEIELTRYGRAVARIVGPKPKAINGLVGCMKGRFEPPADVHAGDAEIEELFAVDEIQAR